MWLFHQGSESCSKRIQLLTTKYLLFSWRVVKFLEFLFDSDLDLNVIGCHIGSISHHMSHSDREHMNKRTGFISIILFFFIHFVWYSFFQHLRPTIICSNVQNLIQYLHQTNLRTVVRGFAPLMFSISHIQLKAGIPDLYYLPGRLHHNEVSACPARIIMIQINSFPIFMWLPLHHVS